MGGQSVDTSTALGQYIFTLLAGAAEMERNLTRERTKAALATKKAKGERVGRLPFGHRLADDGKHIEPDDDEQRTIRLVLKMREQEESHQEVADHLNAKGMFTRGRRGEKTPWTQPIISCLLKRHDSAR